MNSTVPMPSEQNERAQLVEAAPPPNRAARRKALQSLDVINHPGAHLRLSVVLELTGISRSAFYRLIQKNTAPQPLRYGTRCSRWLAADISKFLAERTAKGAQ